MNKELKYELALCIKNAFKEEFNVINLSGNLLNTINIIETKQGYSVEIPAKIYDINLYKKSKAIVFTGDGSYASEVDSTGGFSGTHKDYINRCIYKGIQDWLNLYNLKGKIKK